MRLDKAINKGPCLNEARTSHAPSDLGNENGVLVADALSRSGDPEQRLVREAFVQALDEPLDGLRLIARRRVVRHELEGAMIRLVHDRYCAAVKAWLIERSAPT